MITHTASLVTGIFLLTVACASAAESKVSVGAVAGMTGFGGDVSWRFHDNLALTGRYTDGLSIGTDYGEDGVNYDADFDLKASSLKLDYFPRRQYR